MRKELLLVSGLLIGSMAFAIDPAEIDSLINLKGVVVSANKIHVNRNSVPLSISVIEREEIEASSESALLPVLSDIVGASTRAVCHGKRDYRFWRLRGSGRDG